MFAHFDHDKLNNHILRFFISLNAGPPGFAIVPKIHHLILALPHQSSPCGTNTDLDLEWSEGFLTKCPHPLVEKHCIMRLAKATIWNLGFRNVESTSSVLLSELESRSHFSLGYHLRQSLKICPNMATGE
ncbi:hypothetical protein K7432_014836, partial [Basidiobolus ranarum]